MILLYFAYVVPRSPLSSIGINSHNIGKLGVAAGEPLLRKAVGFAGWRAAVSDYATVIDYLPAEYSLLASGVAAGFTVYDAILHPKRH